MNRKIAFTALSAAIVFGSASGAVAAAKKHTDALHAYGSAAGGKTPVDPCDAYWAKRKPSSDLTSCDSDPKCNGWGEWEQAVISGKMKY